MLVADKISGVLNRTRKSMLLTPEYIKKNPYPTAFSMLYNGTCDKCGDNTQDIVKFSDDLKICMNCAVRSGIHAATFPTLEHLVVCDSCETVQYERDTTRLDDDSYSCIECLSKLV